MTTYKPNPDFINSVPEKHRKRWSKALRDAEADPNVRQARGRMLDTSKLGTLGKCCLMVGHEAFGGTDKEREEEIPRPWSPFCSAFKSVSPELAIDEETRTWFADQLNDHIRLTFPQIADLIDGKEVEA